MSYSKSLFQKDQNNNKRAPFNFVFLVFDRIFKVDDFFFSATLIKVPKTKQSRKKRVLVFKPFSI